MKKRSYSSPNIKVVAFQVEQGFDGSIDLKVGKLTTDEHDQIVPLTQGSERFGRETLTVYN